MVDFQSRDTRRGLDDDDEDEQTAAATDEQTEETADEQSAGTVEGTADEPTTDVDESATAGESFAVAVVTVADERTVAEDATGDAVVDAVEHAGETVATRELVGRDYDAVQSAVDVLADRGDVSAVVTVGGTGVEPDDVTVEAVEPLFDKELPGFGELFRVLSHDFEGTAVVRTRATAGVVGGVPVFCLPGDTEAARRGVEQIVLEEAETIAEQAGALDGA